MINDIRNFHFYKNKNCFSGDFRGMRFFIDSKDKEEGKVFEVCVWPDVKCRTKTRDEEKTFAEFPFTKEGFSQVQKWLDDKYEMNIEKWDKYKKFWCK